ncbi:MAG: hypothetical protein HEP71_08965 [Roseivirga sp.]|nr:hypothetical protein [Roseivirga sp.]
MKRKLLQLSLMGLLTFLTLSLDAYQRKKEPQFDLNKSLDYMQAISHETSQISQDMMSYISAAAHSKRAKKIDKRRQEVVGTIFQAARKIKRMPDFRGDGSYRDAAIAYLEVRYRVMNEDYAQIVDMEELAQESYDGMEAYLLMKEKVDEKLDAAFLEFKEGQRKFASDNNITLVDGEKDKLSIAMEKTGRVNKYNNQVYLIYWKSRIEEKHLWKAVKAGDLSAMEQRKNSMLQYSQEGLVKLQELGGFDGDKGLIIACGKALRFFEAHANNDVDKLQEFFLSKEQFENVKKAYDNKRSSDRTQEDVDRYNNALKKYNGGIDTYNNVVASTNKGRTAAINGYNEASDKFRNRHTPRYK